MQSASGIVISVHQLGAMVRLDDGSLAAVPESELAANRPVLVASLRRREPLAFAVEHAGRHAVAYLNREPGPDPRTAPRLADTAFETQMNRYLKSTEEWAPPDRPPPAERHFIRKKRRAASFEARHKAP